MPKADAIYVIDTSSLVEIKDKIPKTDRPALFKRLDQLVADGRLVYPVQVVEELERHVPALGKPPQPDVILQWARRNKAKAAEGHGRLLDEAKAVLAVVPRVLDPDKAGGAEEADPYVLGLAQRLDESGKPCTVITEDRKDRPDKMSMATACGKLRLPTLPLIAFLEHENIWEP